VRKSIELNGQLEAAANQLDKLVKSDLVNKLRGANEAKVRLLVIDEVLSILGWQKHEYELSGIEQHSGSLRSCR